MNKKLLIGILAGLVVLYVVVDFFLGSIVKAGVNHWGPEMTQTRVELSGAHLSPLTGSGTLSGLFVGNPKGWSSDKAFYLGKMHIVVEPTSLFRDTIVVDEITIDEPEFVYETKFVASNIGDLVKNLQQTSDSGSGAPAAKSGRPLKIMVKHFRLQNGRVTLGIGPTALTLPMPPITLDDLGGSDGITPAQLAVAVMRSVLTGLASTTTQAVGKVGSTMGAAAGNAVGKAAEGIQGLFGKH